MAHASTPGPKRKKKKKVGENNGQLRFIRHHGWRTQARLDQNWRNCSSSLKELIFILPKVLDKRSAEREQATAHRRVIFHHKIVQFDKALEEASWELNAGGMKVYFEALTMAPDMKDHFEVVDGDISETYTGKHTAPYKGN